MGQHHTPKEKLVQLVFGEMRLAVQPLPLVTVMKHVCNVKMGAQLGQGLKPVFLMNGKSLPHPVNYLRLALLPSLL